VRTVLDYPYVQALGVSDSIGLVFAFAIMVGLAVSTIVPLFLIAFSRPLGDVIVPSAKAALAVGTGVAPWVGASKDDHLIRIPPGSWRALNFARNGQDKAAAIARAERATLEYVDTVLAPDSHSSLGGRPPLADVPGTVDEPGSMSRVAKIRALLRPNFSRVW